VAIATGIWLNTWQTRLVTVTPVAGVRLAMQASWQVKMDPQAVFHADDTFSGGTQVGDIRLTVINRGSDPILGSVPTPDGEEEIRGLAAWWTIRHAREQSWWKPLDTEFLYRNGTWMAVVRSLRLEEAGAANRGVPVVRQTREVLWQQGTDVYHVSLYVAGRDGTPDERRMSRLVASIRPQADAVEGGDAP
jgi:hypothetical protein